MSLIVSDRPDFDRFICDRCDHEPGGSTLALPMSDEASLLVDEVCQALRSTGYPALRDISVEVEAGQMLLRGNVPSYFLKQQAQTVAREIGRRYQIRNEIDVSPASIRSRPVEGVSGTRAPAPRGHG